jgi:hypothetical protein
MILARSLYREFWHHQRMSYAPALARSRTRRDGAVAVTPPLVGFRATAVPAPSTGLSRVLTDVDVLCSECVPRWLASAGIGPEQLDESYLHPRKRAVDATLAGAHYLRRLYTDPGLGWRVRRLRHALGMRRAGWWDYFFMLNRKPTA